jgi:hypothetical protein
VVCVFQKFLRSFSFHALANFFNSSTVILQENISYNDCNCNLSVLRSGWCWVDIGGETVLSHYIFTKRLQAKEAFQLFQIHFKCNSTCRFSTTSSRFSTHFSIKKRMITKRHCPLLYLIWLLVLPTSHTKT